MKPCLLPFQSTQEGIVFLPDVRMIGSGLLLLMITLIAEFVVPKSIPKAGSTLPFSFWAKSDLSLRIVASLDLSKKFIFSIVILLF